MRTPIGIAIAALVILTVLNFSQAQKTRRLEEKIALLEERVTSSEGLPAPPRRGEVQASISREADQRDWQLLARVDQLEAALESVTEITSRFAERRNNRLDAGGLADMRSRFLDLSQDAESRVRALDLLRRNDGMDDQVVSEAFALLQSSTDAEVQEELLEQLNDVTNRVYAATLMSMTSGDYPADVREEAIQNLRHFVDDPSIEDSLWNTLANDPDEDIREAAEDALMDGPVTPNRAARLLSKAMDGQTTIDQRLLAMRSLEEAGAATPELMRSMAEMAQNSQDPHARAEMFRAFDGIEDPALKSPLVYGLQDPNPVVREVAVDALSGQLGDPAVEKWLRYVMESDPDPGVRREAFDVLED